MDKTKKPADQQSDQNGNESIEHQEGTVCSPEFIDGCMDVETGETES